jgi:NAD(P)-dependent dehydrogenase (short-subunit alcohol dehydrogenase family)
MSDFKDKVAIVTGGSRGVGYATAKALVERGAKVVITARGEERLHDSEKKLKDMGGEAVAVAGDVGDWADAEKMVKAAMDNFGRIDVLVNNAGVSMRGHFSELSAEVCDRVVRTNLLGCITLTHLAMDQLIENQGNVVFISSIAGLFGLPGASI